MFHKILCKREIPCYNSLLLLRSIRESKTRTFLVTVYCLGDWYVLSVFCSIGPLAAKKLIALGREVCVNDDLGYFQLEEELKEYKSIAEQTCAVSLYFLSMLLSFFLIYVVIFYLLLLLLLLLIILCCKRWINQHYTSVGQRKKFPIGFEPMALYPLSYENSWRARSLNWVHMWHTSCILLGSAPSKWYFVIF